MTLGENRNRSAGPGPCESVGLCDLRSLSRDTVRHGIENGGEVSEVIDGRRTHGGVAPSDGDELRGVQLDDVGMTEEVAKPKKITEPRLS